MSNDILLTLVEQYKEAAQLIEAAQAEQEALRTQIKESLAATWKLGATRSGCLTFPAHDWTAKPSRQLPRTCTPSTAKPSQASA